MVTSKSQTPPLVLVTGASGFIATHCILQLLEAGYQVRGSVRSLSRCAEIEAALKERVDLKALSFVELDLLDDKGWNEAMEGVHCLMHVASPFPASVPKDEMDLIRPAREGTLRALKAAAHAGVNKVVLTSSIAAIISGHEAADEKLFTEADWSNVDGEISAYAKSKTLAEKAAWHFVESLEDEARFEFCTINPGLVLGPSLTRDQSTSAEVIRKLLAREVPGCPDLNLALVDVRDVAAAHLKAMTSDESTGQRFIVANESVAFLQIAQTLKHQYESKGYKVPARSIPKWLLRIVALVDKSVGLIVPEIGRRRNVSSKHAAKVLGWTSRSLEQMTQDTAESLIAHGLIRAPKNARRGAAKR